MSFIAIAGTALAIGAGVAAAGGVAKAVDGGIKANKAKKAAEKAQIASTIEEWPDRYDTEIGERGVRLSGGQRQRIGIARALYKEADVIVFDEATSALDNQTEKNIMQQISKLKSHQTILIIAHRLSTLEQCDSIIRLNANHNIERAKFDQIFLKNNL